MDLLRQFHIQVSPLLSLQYLHQFGRSDVAPHTDSQLHVLSELYTRIYSKAFRFVCNKKYGVALLKIQKPFILVFPGYEAASWRKWMLTFRKNV